MDSPCGLLWYFNDHAGSLPRREEARIVVFHGKVMGTGPDLEPLVVPQKVIAWLDPASVAEICRLEERDSDEAVLRLVRRLAEPAPTPGERAASKSARSTQEEATERRWAATNDAVNWAFSEALGQLPWDSGWSLSDVFVIEKLVQKGVDRGMATWQLRVLAKSALTTATDRPQGTTVEQSLGDLTHYIERLPSGRRRNPAPPGTSHLFHVTYFKHLSGISRFGLVPARCHGQGIGSSPLGEHCRIGVFLSQAAGVVFWAARAQEWAEHRSDRPACEMLAPVVLRVEVDPACLGHDEEGSRDAAFDAYVSACKIPPKRIEVWDGDKWLPIRMWRKVDFLRAFACEQDPDDPDNVLQWFAYPNPLTEIVEEEPELAAESKILVVHFSKSSAFKPGWFVPGGSSIQGLFVYPVVSDQQVEELQAGWPGRTAWFFWADPKDLEEGEVFEPGEAGNAYRFVELFARADVFSRLRSTDEDNLFVLIPAEGPLKFDWRRDAVRQPR